MSKSNLTDHNATPPDGDDSGLRGGTQGGRSAPLLPTNDIPSNASAPLPGGPNTRRQGLARGTDDPTDAIAQADGDSTRHPSAAAVRQAAREAADVPPDLSRNGIDAGNKANEPRTDTSAGNHASTSGRKLFDAPEDESDAK